MMKSKQLQDLLPYFKQHPEELLVSAEEIAAINPLEVPFLFNDRELATLLKFLMRPHIFKLAIAALQEKYPKLSLKVLIDANLHVDTPIVHKLSAKEDIPPVPGIEFDKLKVLFGDIEIFYSDQLAGIEQNEVSFDSDSKVLQRKVIEVPGDGDSTEKEVVIAKEIEFGTLKKLEFDQLTVSESGKIQVGSVEYPYVIMKIGNVMMPVRIFREDARNVVELRVELLKALFNRINFTDNKAPGYRDPKNIIDSGSSENSAPTQVSPEQLKMGLKDLCDAINFRIPYVGTPKSDEPEKLEDWYRYLEDIVKHAINASIDEDFKARGKGSVPETKSEKSKPRATDKDPTPSAPSVIELGISGLHCGTRSLDDAQFLYDTKFDNPQTVEDRVLRIIEKLKTGIGEKMVDLTNAHNVHVKNKILQVIDVLCGIPEEDKKKRYYFNDPIVPKLIDSEKIMKIFNREFTPTAIIDVVDSAINGPPKEIDGELIIDWFKDNIPDEREREKYQQIKLGLQGKGTKEKKAKYLEKFDIFINPVNLKKAKEPNWERIIKDDRKACYLKEEVVDMMTGKIKRTAIIDMLNKFGVFKS